MMISVSPLSTPFTTPFSMMFLVECEVGRVRCRGRSRCRAAGRGRDFVEKRDTSRLPSSELRLPSFRETSFVVRWKRPPLPSNVRTLSSQLAHRVVPRRDGKRGPL